MWVTLRAGVRGRGAKGQQILAQSTGLWEALLSCLGRAVFSGAGWVRQLKQESKTGPEVLKAAVEDGGKTGRGGGAGMQECGKHGGMAFGEVLGFARPLPCRPMASQVAPTWALATGVALWVSQSPQP